MEQLSDIRTFCDYILLSPVAIHKQYCLDRFIESVKSLVPAPKEIHFCIDWDAFELRDKLSNIDDIIVHINPNIGDPSSFLTRISYAREILRNHFIKTDYDWALWVDSDILLPSDMVETLINTQEGSQAAVVVHGYVGRNYKSIWHGSGIMWTSNESCSAGTFYTDLTGRFHVSEDYVFLATNRSIKGYMYKLHGIGGVVNTDERLDDILHVFSANMTDEELLDFARESYDLYRNHSREKVEKIG